jgi:hypothetical protein
MMIRVNLTNPADKKDRVYLDLSVDDQMKPLPDIPYFGFVGSLNNSADGFGALLLGNGTINETYGRTNLRNHPIVVGEYVTIWWRQQTGPEVEVTYQIAAATQLSAITQFSGLPKATVFAIASLDEIPHIRARLIRPVQIEGYDDTVYCAPTGTEGDIAFAHDTYIFFPDGAVSQDGKIIDTTVDGDDVELIFDDEVIDTTG